jgi:hypothetical protein
MKERFEERGRGVTLHKACIRHALGFVPALSLICTSDTLWFFLNYVRFTMNTFFSKFFMPKKTNSDFVFKNVSKFTFFTESRQSINFTK